MRDSMVSNSLVAFLRMLTSCEIELKSDFFAPFIMARACACKIQIATAAQHLIFARSSSGDKESIAWYMNSRAGSSYSGVHAGACSKCNSIL